MSRQSIAQRRAIDERRNLVDAFLRRADRPYTCDEIARCVGIKKHQAIGATKILVLGGAAKKAGHVLVPTARGGYNRVALYETTGHPFNQDAVGQPAEHNEEHYIEPEGGIQEVRLGPNHRLIRFGKKSPKNHAQTNHAGPRTRSSLDW